MRRAGVCGASFLWFLLPSALSPFLFPLPEGSTRALVIPPYPERQCPGLGASGVIGQRSLEVLKMGLGYIYGSRGVLKQAFHIAVRCCICHLSALVDTSSVGPRYTTISWTRCERFYCPTVFGDT